MRISILTLFPDMFTGPLNTSIVKRAIEKNLVEISYINIRDFSLDAYKSVDGHPYGGGTGMVMRVDVIERALAHAKSQNPRTDDQTKIVLLDAGGTPYTQQKARDLSTIDHLILICGHYEGVDERVRTLVHEEISIGDYVLTGGEIPAMVITDSVVRLVTGVLKPEATIHESFTDPTLEYPQYTEPQDFNGLKVPDILISGNHAKIDAWRKEESRKRTKNIRPDLIKD